ncbi:MAG: YggS family pyridoxal phosphate-dependent enzyme [Phycisphaerales bacterium]
MTSGTQDASGTTLRQRFEDVKSRIAAAARRAGRRPEEVLLCVVTKSGSVDQIRELIQLGHADFAENRVQQLVQRAAQIDEWRRRQEALGLGAGAVAGASTAAPIRWHMIGTLQRNKVRKAIECARLIHSVDSLRLAEEIQVAATRRERPVEVLVEVNIAGEGSKQGVAPGAVRHLVRQIETMTNVKARGMMCMAPLEGGQEAARTTFTRCRELFEEIRQSGAGGERFDILSMGMSGDFEVAVECGSNLVRVGGAVIGPPQVTEGPDEE